MSALKQHGQRNARGLAGYDAGDYDATIDGTSAATPLVSAAVAQVLRASSVGYTWTILTLNLWTSFSAPLLSTQSYVALATAVIILMNIESSTHTRDEASGVVPRHHGSNILFA